MPWRARPSLWACRQRFPLGGACRETRSARLSLGASDRRGSCGGGGVLAARPAPLVARAAHARALAGARQRAGGRAARSVMASWAGVAGRLAASHRAAAERARHRGGRAPTSRHSSRQRWRQMPSNARIRSPGGSAHLEGLSSLREILVRRSCARSHVRPRLATPSAQKRGIPSSSLGAGQWGASGVRPVGRASAAWRRVGGGHPFARPLVTSSSMSGLVSCRAPFGPLDIEAAARAVRVAGAIGPLWLQRRANAKG